MSSIYQDVCIQCSQPCFGYYCDSCLCPQCGRRFLNGTCVTCIYGDGKPLTCSGCEGMLRGGFCFSCNFKAENSSSCYQNAYSFDYTSNNSNYLSQPQYENYWCNLCSNNSHDGYDCQQQFLFVYEQEPSYNQNCDGNYYPHESPFPCCDNCGGSHETFQCQPIAQNIDFSGSDQIQTPQYPDVHPPSQEISDEVFQANHSVQNEENLENSSNSNQEQEIPPQDSDIHQLIKECSTEVSKEQKQSMEDTKLELVKICQEKEFLCIHDNVDDLIESVLNSKLLLINSNSQRLNKEHQEVKNVVEQPAERGNRSIQSLQNFRVVHKYYISFKNTSQISSIHAVATILSTKEPEHSLSMGYEHLSITPETESDEVTESNAKNLLPIPNECEVTSKDESKCDMPIQDQSSSAITTFSNPLFNNDDLDSSNDESLPDEDVPAEEFKIYSNLLFNEGEINYDKLDPHCFNVESDFVEFLLNRDTLIDSSSKFDFSCELAHVNPEIKEFDFDFEEEIRLIENLLYDNSSPRPSKELNAKIADTIVESIPSLPIPVQDGGSQREEIDIVTETDNVLPSSVENDNDSSNDLLLEEADLFLASDSSIPPGIENFANDSEGDIHFLEELLIDDSILSHESSDSNFEDNPSIPRPPPEPPDEEFDFEIDFGVEILVVRNTIVKFECIDARVKFDVFNDENDDLSYFMFANVFSFLFAESEDTVFDPESDEVTKSNAENLLPILSKCEVTLEDEIECDKPIQDQSYLAFTTFSNPLFNNDDLDFSDDESLPNEDVPAEDFKVYSNPFFDEDEINSDKLDPHCFNVESDFVESLLNRDTFIDFSSKFDFS
nr:hypothetical protein [Tanacetum cinerariifolium]